MQLFRKALEHQAATLASQVGMSPPRLVEAFLAEVTEVYPEAVLERAAPEVVARFLVDWVRHRHLPAAARRDALISTVYVPRCPYTLANLQATHRDEPEPEPGAANVVPFNARTR